MLKINFKQLHINKDMVHEALKQFNELFNDTSNEEKKALLRALIKEVHMESDRTTLKKSSSGFWRTMIFRKVVYQLVMQGEPYHK
ncbi:hypothetical protein [Paenibacillus sp. FSL L8-0708]|uniref:Uncharacterized protein n=1 Tax=Paenibacillus odorifer TaxID=189426 RepID=A0ABX3GYH3_9BACL|nr:hypothetical protein BSO21_01735 [Paenibacillus odorifer]